MFEEQKESHLKEFEQKDSCEKEASIPISFYLSKIVVFLQEANMILYPFSLINLLPFSHGVA